jgi:ABC-type polysaccharide/polyol phosphate export permease
MSLEALGVNNAELRPLATTAREDLFRGLLKWHIYGRLGYLEVKRRYRRTVLGPFWGTASLALTIAAMGSIGVGLWQQNPATYFPFLAAGLIVWVFMQSILTDSCSLFTSNSNLFRQTRLDYSILAYALVWRNVIAFLHNVGAYLVVITLFTGNIGWPVLLLIPGLALVMINAVWIALLFGIASLRYRDLQPLVANIVQIAIFVTPIFWPPEVLQTSSRVVFVTFNPLYHLIEVIRLPLMNGVPTAFTYKAVGAIATVGWIIAYTVFGRYRRRIAYWS